NIKINLEHDRGAYNGRAMISGLVCDQRGDAVQGARIAIEDRSAVTDDHGEFTIPALLPGNYEVKIVARAESLARKLTLVARDHATLTVRFHNQPEGPLVVAVARQFAAGARFQPGLGGGGMGVVGGVPGGVLGGIVGGVQMQAAGQQGAMAEMLMN